MQEFLMQIYFIVHFWLYSGISFSNGGLRSRDWERDPHSLPRMRVEKPTIYWSIYLLKSKPDYSWHTGQFLEVTWGALVLPGAQTSILISASPLCFLFNESSRIYAVVQTAAVLNNFFLSITLFTVILIKKGRSVVALYTGLDTYYSARDEYVK